MVHVCGIKPLLSHAISLLQLNYSVDASILFAAVNRVDNMVEPKPLLRFSVFIALLAYLTASVPAMSYKNQNTLSSKKQMFMGSSYRSGRCRSYGEEDSGFRV